MNDNDGDHRYLRSTINSALNDDCLRILFERHFSLRSQLQLRLVCKRWYALITQILGARRSLKLFGSTNAVEFFLKSVENFKVNEQIDFPGIDHYEYDGLLLCGSERLSRAACKALPAIFPTVRRVVINFPSMNHWPDVLAELLYAWRDSLQILIIYSLPPIPNSENSNKNNAAYDYDDNSFEQLWSVLNSLKALKKICLTRLPYKMCLPAADRLPQLLHQLDHFSISHYLHDVEPIFVQLHAVEALKFTGIQLDASRMETILRSNPSLMTNITILGIGRILCSPNNKNSRIDNFVELLHLACTRLTRLDFLDILMADQVSWERDI